MIAKITLDRAGLLRQVERLRARKQRAFAQMNVDAQNEMKEVVTLAQGNAPVATGESRGKIHVMMGSSGRNQFRTGMGALRTTNEQAIRMERGGVSVHRNMEEHDPGGRRCSSGWDEDEPEDVRARMNHLEANPNAMTQPIGRAIIQRLGPVIDLNQSKGFGKGMVNMYTRAKQFSLFGCPIMERLRRAAMKGMALLAILLWVWHAMPLQAQLVLNKWDVGDFKVIMTDTMIAPGATVRTPDIRIDHIANSPSVFTAYLDVASYGAVLGVPSLAVFVQSGRDSGGCDYFQYGEGDTVWAIEPVDAYEDTGKISFVCEPPGGNWMNVNFVNLGGGDTVTIDTLILWKKH